MRRNSKKKAEITIADLSELTLVPYRTLQDWKKKKPVLYDLLVTGAAFKRTIERLNEQ